MTIEELEGLIRRRLKHGIKRISINITDIQDLIDIVKNAQALATHNGVTGSLAWEGKFHTLFQSLSKIKWKKEKAEGDIYNPEEWD